VAADCIRRAHSDPSLRSLAGPRCPVLGERWDAGKSDTPITESGGDGGEAAEPVPQECICNDECSGRLTCTPGTYGPEDTGGGPLDPNTGLRRWYEPEPEAAAGAGTVTSTWADILFGHWSAIEEDLLVHRGIDVESGILDARSWRWLKARISGLTDDPTTRLHAALTKAA